MVITTKSTAVVLAYQALGVGMHVEGVQLEFLSELEKPGVTDALASAIGDAIVARGENWLDPTDTAIKLALGNLVKSFIPPATFGAILNPTERISGIQVVADGAGSAIVKNYYRRRLFLYVDRVSYRDIAGVDIPSKGTVGSQPTKVSAVKGLGGSLGTIIDLAAGNKDYYDPQVTDPYDVPVFPTNATSTKYTITAVGLAGPSHGDLALLTPAQNAGWIEVSILSLFVDLVVPMIINVVLPIVGGAIDEWTKFFNASSGVKDFIAALGSRPDIVQKIQDGAIADALLDTIFFFINSDTLRNSILKVFSDFVASGLPGAPVLGAQARTDFAQAASTKLLKFIGLFDYGFAIFDAAVTASDILRSNAATVFTLDVTNATAHLNPSEAVANYAGVAIPFLAVVTNADLPSDAILSYTWSNTGKFGDISDGTHTGLSFDSSSNGVSYAPNGHGIGGDMDTITVKIYKGAINSRSPLGEAKSTITIKATITPDKPNVQTSGTQEFTVHTNANTAIGASYEWSVAGGHGSVGNTSTVVTSIPKITYTAGTTTGSDVLTVKVKAPNGTTRLTATTDVNVTGSSTYTLGPGGGAGAFTVNGNFGLWLNGTVIEYDQRDQGSHNHIIPPFMGQTGDSLRIQVQAQSFNMVACTMDNLGVSSPGKTTLPIAGFVRGQGQFSPGEIVYDMTFSLP